MAIKARVIDRIISVNEAAELLGLDPSRVRALIDADQILYFRDRRLPSARMLGKTWALLQSDVLEFAKVPRIAGRPSKERAIPYAYPVVPMWQEAPSG